MYLKRLELSGFKSFGKKSTILFDAPVTAVVGPNGSGKSNVAEAIRFVLGEQSMKSLRGKSGADMIFRGSKTLPKQNRASVSIVFDNTKKIFTLDHVSLSGDTTVVDFDEITLTREVYADGGNRYSINGSEVRLKDIVELLASVNIGASGHHIISQGEADRILSASLRERRAMIEDALGLKVYQYRIKESQKKLEKTQANIKEVGLLRREIAPHMQFLKRQVEKLEKAKEIREELEREYRLYLKKEEEYIKNEKEYITATKSTLRAKLAELSSALAGAIEDAHKQTQSALEEKRVRGEEALRMARSSKDELSRKLARLEGMIELEERRQTPASTGASTVHIPQALLADFRAKVRSEIDTALALESLTDIRTALSRIKEMVRDFMPEKLADGERQFDRERSIPLLAELKDQKRSLVLELETSKIAEADAERAVEEIRALLDRERLAEKERDKTHFEAQMREREIKNESSLLALREEALTKRSVAFEEGVREGSILIGARVFGYRTVGLDEIAEIDEVKHEERRRHVERLKIKLEDMGVAGGDDIVREYEDVTARDQFLVREVEDLEKTIVSLEELLRELVNDLETAFKEGLAKINEQFQTFFATMFGGGTALLSLAVDERRRRVRADALEEETDSSDEEKEEGIEIAVSLPHKKVRDIQMFSGGERSLTSIALLFAISQVNPPPFLVLDETDAALDEANSKKYGDMIERLSEYSQLIVITHNRETMSRAQVLYGVTVGADGASKLLSVKFEDAVAIAK